MRACGGCTVCCDVLPIPELGRGWNDGCRFCASGVGCLVYEERAQRFHPVCVTYTCAWNLGHGEIWDRPDNSGVLVDRRAGHDGRFRWYAIYFDDRESPESLSRICDDLRAPVIRADRNGKALETWQP